MNRVFNILKPRIVVVELYPEIKHLETINIVIVSLLGKTVYNSLPKKYKNSRYYAAYAMPIDATKEHIDICTKNIVDKLIARANYKMPTRETALYKKQKGLN